MPCLLIHCFRYDLLDLDRTRNRLNFIESRGWVGLFLGFPPFVFGEGFEENDDRV